MNKDVISNRIIFDTVVGSHAYGTNLESSDIDTVAVAIPPKEYFFSTKKFEQFSDFEDDRTIYDLRKMVSLMLENNPNCIDILFAPTRCYRKITLYWERLLEVRDSFLSTKVKHCYLGYSWAQLQRIKVHRKFLENPLQKPPERKNFGLPDISIFPMSQLDGLISIADSFYDQDTKDELVHDLKAIYSDQILPLIKDHLIDGYRNIALENLNKGMMSQIKAISIISSEYIKEEYKEAAIRELTYADALSAWKKYSEWKKNRNPKRAELENKYGVDTKFCMHCIRLLNMGLEIIKTGKVNVDRTGIDADMLIDIRNGRWTYEQVVEYSDSMISKLEESYKTSPLRRSPDSEKVNKVMIGIIEDYLRYNQWTS
jgi:uncharacterized protein